ncbi:MAG: hypothetical protein Q8P67_07965, partial [archaeon]|nr:hypothetical protein [archaeon]
SPAPLCLGASPFSCHASALQPDVAKLAFNFKLALNFKYGFHFKCAFHIALKYAPEHACRLTFEFIFCWRADTSYHTNHPHSSSFCQPCKCECCCCCCCCCCSQWFLCSAISCSHTGSSSSSGFIIGS